MLEYLEKFNNLPDEVKKNISSATVMAAIEELEGRYGVDLANFVIRVMVGDLYYKNITANLIIEFSLTPEMATKLAKELQDKIFNSVMEYLTTGKMSSPVAPMQAVPIRSAKAPVASKPANFLEEDKKDIAAMASATASLKTVSQEKFSRLLEEIVKESNIVFASEVLQKRYRDILYTYLRSIRTKIEVRENLMKDIASGGVKMSSIDADRVLNIAQKKLAADQEKSIVGKVSAQSNVAGTNFIFNQEEIKKATEQKSSFAKATADKLDIKKVDFGALPARDVEYDLSALKSSSVKATEDKSSSAKASIYAKVSEDRLPFAKASEDKSSVGAVIQRPEPQQNKDLPKAPVKIIPASEPKISENIKEKESVLPAKNLGAENIASLRNDVPAAGNKQKMEDIKPAPKIMSPIDELAYMDLVNFRRLDSSPAKRTAKIEEKISLLEKEGIDKKIAGIKAWRNNPVSKTYLAMGQESIGSTKTIDDIIKERKDQGLNYLSKEEFEAVMDLNNNLRF